MKYFFTFVALIAVVLVFRATAAAPLSTPFTFTAAGDHGTGSKTTGSIATVASSGSSFYLALGDLSYTAGGERSWCANFKAKYNHVEVLAGNHDTGESTGGNINTYVQHCPFTLGSLTGDYGKQYYFDYPVSDPLARFIMIAPGVRGSVNIDYTVGGAGYNFTRDAISSARNAGIKWIIVGMHKNCISIGAKTCEVGTAIMRLLIDSKVDLILQSHDHNYQRSHQLSCIQVGAVNSSCIADNGADGKYTKNKGPVIIINGEFGMPLYSVNSGDSEAGYFAKSDSTTWGVMRYTVSEAQISGQYLRSSGGGFADSFSITDPSVPSPQTYAADTFGRRITDGWGGAETGGAYTLVGTAASFDTTGSAGTISLGTNAMRAAHLPAVAALDADAVVRVATDKPAVGGVQIAYVVARRVSAGNEYRGRIRFTTDGRLMVIGERVVAGSMTLLGGEKRVPNLTHRAGTVYRLRMQISGTNPTTIRLKVWPDGQAEPASWLYTATDSASSLQRSGAVGLQAYLSRTASNAPVLVRFDDFRVTKP